MRSKEIFEKAKVEYDNYSRWQNPSANATMCVAAARKTGLPLVMFVLVDEMGRHDPCHSGVLLPDGRWLDTQGVHRASEAAFPLPCDPEALGLDIDMLPASEADLDRNFGVQFGGIWEADVYMKFDDELRSTIEEYGGNFSYHFD